MNQKEKEELQAKIAAKKAENEAATKLADEEKALIEEAKALGIEVPKVEKKSDTPGEKKGEEKKSDTKDEKNSITAEDYKAIAVEVANAIKDSSQEGKKEELAVAYG